MNRDLWEQLPVYRRIENEVRQLIVRKKLPRHTLLPSEAQLAREFDASVGTVRKALNNLVEQKVIYRRHGQGTFVAPRSRKGRILVIPGGAYADSVHSDYFAFLLGALLESTTADLPHEPVMADREDFFKNLNDARMIYPEIAGVIFFRGYENLESAAPALAAQKLPFLFYGPNLYSAWGKGYSVICHDEEKIAELLADCYARRGFRRAFVVGQPTKISRQRHELLAAALNRRGITSAGGDWDELKLRPDSLREIAGGFDVIGATVSRMALEVVQTLERELGLRVPEAVAVTGVDNFPATWQLRPAMTVVDLCNHENGALCLRRMSEMLGSGGKPFRLQGELRLVERESC